MGIGFAALVPVAYYRLIPDFREALVLTVFTPTWLENSCLGMSEPLYLLALLLAMRCFFMGRLYLSGLLLAIAALTRPTAVFLWVGLALLLVQRRAWRSLLSWSALCALGPLLTLALNGYFYADWTHQSRLHGAPINTPRAEMLLLADGGDTRTYLNVPFKALVLTPLNLVIPPGKIAFVYLHLLAVLAASGIALVQFFRSDFDRVIAVWAILNTCFIVSTGPYWGFHTFDRYCVWALPAYLYFLGRFLTRRVVIVAGIGAASILMALWGLAKEWH
jgi:hypothetical protein